MLLPQPLLAHGGGLDAHGGHYNRSTGVYHCHREPCISQHRTVEQATAEAFLDDRPVELLYRREDWPHWIDEDNDCQNTRAEVLIRDSRGPVKFKRNIECNVTWGEWIDPYTGKQWTKASDLDIDHVVPLKWAHEHGGSQWNRKKKRQFANDMENLLAVEDNLNQEKGAQGPDQWIPPSAAFQCRYLEMWDATLKKYGLHFTNAEREALGWSALACGLTLH